MTTHRELAIQRLVQNGIRKDLAAIVADIVIECFAEIPGPVVSRHLVVGNLRVDQALKMAWKGEQLLILAPREYKMLEYFMARTDRVISNRQILSDLWGRAQGDLEECYRQRMCVCISKVNKAVGYLFIRNRSGMGYYASSEVKVDLKEEA